MLVGAWDKPRTRDALAVVPVIVVLLLLAIYPVSRAFSYIGDNYDDGAYYLMSHNLFLHGTLGLNQTGPMRPSAFWPPGFPLLLAPAGWLTLPAAAVADRVFVLCCAVAVIVLVYGWLRSAARLSRPWSAGVLILVACAPSVVRYSGQVMSDVPSMIFLLGGIILLRRGRLTAGMLMLVLTAAVRAIFLPVPVAVGIWLLATQGRRAIRSVAVAGAGLLALQLYEFAIGSTGNLSEVWLRDPDIPGRGRVGAGEFLVRTAGHAYQLATTRVLDTVTGLAASQSLVSHGRPLLYALSGALLVAVVVGVVRRQLWVEALVIVVVLGVTAAYPFMFDRYVMLVMPLMVGSAAVALEGRARWVGAAAAVALLLALAGDLYEYRLLIPGPGQQQAAASQRLRMYAFIRAAAAPNDAIVTKNDIQAYLYTGHPATRDVILAPAGDTYVIGYPWRDRVTGERLDRLLLRHYSGQVVYQDGDTSVVRARSFSGR